VPTKKWVKTWENIMFSNNINYMRQNRDKAMLLKNDNIPSSLFQFRAINKFSLFNLHTNTIWMNTPNNFNDPFDSAFAMKIPVDPIFDTPLCNSKTSISKEECDIIKTIVSKTNNEINKKRVKDIKEYYSISCFSENKDSILMWSHYADQHKGFCIEYDTRTIPSNEEYKRNLLMPVIYSHDFLDMYEYWGQHTNINNPYAFHYAATRKSPVWRYEKEWRLIVEHEPFNMKFIAPCKIFLGAKISQKDEEIVMNFLPTTNVKLYKMEVDANSFQLRAKQFG